MGTVQWEDVCEKLWGVNKVSVVNEKTSEDCLDTTLGVLKEFP